MAGRENAAVVLAQECFLSRYSESLWEDGLNPKCSILPLLCKETRTADKLWNLRHVLHYCPTRGKTSLSATTESMRPGLTHLTIRCSLPVTMKAKRRTPLGKAVILQIDNVLSNARNMRTLLQLVLDLKGLERYLGNGVSSNDLFGFIFQHGFPQLNSLVVRGQVAENMTAHLFGVLQRATGIKDFHVETCWGSVAYTSISKQATVVVNEELDTCTLASLLLARELSTMHFTLNDSQTDSRGEMLERAHVPLNIIEADMPEGCKFVVDFHMETFHTDLLGYMDCPNPVRFNLHRHF